MKVKILEGCTACGACVAINSDVFELNSGGIHVHEQQIEGNESDCINAAIACPVNVIQIEE